MHPDFMAPKVAMTTALLKQSVRVCWPRRNLPACSTVYTVITVPYLPAHRPVKGNQVAPWVFFCTKNLPKRMLEILL